jgi:hypothetical protein
MLIIFGFLKVPRINSCFTMLAYHCAFGLEDEWVENLVVDRLGS